MTRLPTCPLGCGRDHPQTEDCDGRPIDWAARRARALAWLRLPASQARPRPMYQYEDEDAADNH